VSSVRFEGVPVALGGGTYIVPPLSTGAMRRMADDIDKLGSSDSAVAEQERATRVIHAALVRNYPELAIETLEELIDAHNVKDLLAAVFGQSAVAPVGETKAPQSSADQSTGSGSTPP
jgi:hypothetical protein